MKKIVLIFLVFFNLFLFAFAQENQSTEQSSLQDTLSAETKTEEAPEEKRTRFSMTPSLGLTYLNSSSTNEEKENMQWLAKLDSRFSYEGKRLQFNSSLFAQYGQIHSKGVLPQKFQDDFILTLTPSLTIIKKPAIRLFLETTAETDMGKGVIEDRPSSFMDPLFLYQTLFIGQKQFLIQNQSNDMFELTYGLGYAFQQTFTKDFKPDTLAAAGSQSTFESGLSAVFQIDMNVALSQKMKLKFNTKAIAFSKKDFFKDVNSSRGSVLLGAGLFYSLVGIEYNMHMVYDKNYSPRRTLEQSLLFTFALDI